MVMHDWTRADAYAFGSFQLCWTVGTMSALNQGGLPAGIIASIGYSAPQTRDRSAIIRRQIVVQRFVGREPLAVIEIISRKNKFKKREFDDLVAGSIRRLHEGVNLLLIDPFPSAGGNNVHAAIWRGLTGDKVEGLPDKPLTITSYVAKRADAFEVYWEPLAVGDAIPDAPLFLSPDTYVSAPINRGYGFAWDAHPDFLRERLSD